jgi:hypothetical protein
VVAFCVAPLGYPATMVVSSALIGWPPSALASIFWVFLPIGYAGTLLVGIPVYRFLLARNWTAFRVAPIVGFVAGASVCTAVYSAMTFSLGLNLPLREGGVATIRSLAGLIQTGGLCGAAVGILLWLIARPDRQPRNVSAAE